MGLAPEVRLTGGSVSLVIGALFALLGLGLLWWGVLSLRDGERRHGILCIVSGLVLVASALSLYGVL